MSEMYSTPAPKDSKPKNRLWDEKQIPSVNVFENPEPDEDEETDDSSTQQPREQITLTKSELDEIITKKLQLFWKNVKSEQMFWERKNEGVTKKQMFWENPKNEQMFWENRKREAPQYWEQDKRNYVVDKAQDELKQVFDKKASTSEVRHSYQEHLEAMMDNPKAYTQEQRDSLVSAAFGDIAKAMYYGGMTSKDEAAVNAARNARAANKFRAY